VLTAWFFFGLLARREATQPLLPGFIVEGIWQDRHVIGTLTAPIIVAGTWSDGATAAIWSDDNVDARWTDATIPGIWENGTVQVKFHEPVAVEGYIQ
jgi:hypothetical protein